MTGPVLVHNVTDLIEAAGNNAVVLTGDGSVIRHVYGDRFEMTEGDLAGTEVSAVYALAHGPALVVKRVMLDKNTPLSRFDFSDVPDYKPESMERKRSLIPSWDRIATPAVLR